MLARPRSTNQGFVLCGSRNLAVAWLSFLVDSLGSDEAHRWKLLITNPIG